MIPRCAWLIDGKAILHADRLDAKYYNPHYHKVVAYIKSQYGDKISLLGQLCDIKRGEAPYRSEYVAHGVPVIRTDDISGRGIRWDNVAFIPRTLYERKFEGKELKKDDILLTSTGVSTGKVDIVSFIPRKFGGVALITPKVTLIRLREEYIDKINPYFLTTFLRTWYGQVQIKSQTRGSGEPELYPQDIANIIVPILSPKEQRWIGEPLAEAEELRREKFELKERLTEWEHELLEEVSLPRAFVIPGEDLKDRLDAKFYYHRERARVSFRIKTVELGAVIESITTGSTPGRYDYKGSGVPILKVGNLTNEGIDWENISFIDVDFYESRGKAHVMNEDVVIVSAAHSPEGIGKKADVVIIPEELGDKCMAVAELLIIRPDKRKINPYFLAWALRLEPVRMQMRGMLRGQSAHLYPQDASELLIPYPPRDIQDEIGDMVKKIMELRIQANVLQKEAENRLIQLLTGEG